MVAVPAAPTPVTTTRSDRSGFFTIRSAFSSAASTTTAVPCWSSWKTGMSSSLRSRSSTSKQRGAAMSSRLTPPNAGAIALDRLDDLADVLGGQTDREGVDAGELLEEHRLAFHHRQRRLGADVAEAQHGRAVGDHGHGVLLDRQGEGPLAVVPDRQADPGHARGVGHREVVAGPDRDLVVDLDLAAQVHEERAVGDVDDPDAGQSLEPVDDLLAVARCPRALIVMSRTIRSRVDSTRSTAPMSPPASPMAMATRPSMPGRLVIDSRTVML